MMIGARSSTKSPAVFRVFSEKLDNSKDWYLLTEDICCKTPSKFSENSIFSEFAAEIKAIDLNELYDSSGSALPPSIFYYKSKTQPKKVFVASAFGLVSGLLRQNHLSVVKDLPVIRKALEEINKIDLCQAPLQNGGSSSPGKTRLPLSPISPHVTSGQPHDFMPHLTSTPKNSRTGPRPKLTNISSIENGEDLLPATKKRRIRERARNVMAKVENVCEENNESLGDILAECCASDPATQHSDAREYVQRAFDKVCSKKGIRKAFELLTSDEAWNELIQTMRVADWKLLLLKLEARISDNGWQTLTNLTQLGRSGNSLDIPILLNKNQIKAYRSMIFQRIKDLFGLKEIPANVSGYQVDLRSVLIWCAREMRLHGCPSKDKLIFSLKLDGRPFYGRRQVLVALSPLQSPLLPVQSSKAIYPLAISNCEEDRNDLKELLQDLNHQKRALKKDGLHVDGKHWQVEFKVTLDLKALYVLLQKEDDDDFELGGRGLDVECCFLCPAVRGCPSDCKMKNSKCCPDHFEGSKANIGGFKGIREDLVFLLDEELTSITICTLHCELRNTEQLLKSFGLVSYRIGALDEYNQELKKYSSETFTGNRISIKAKRGQDALMAEDRNSIKVVSFSGGIGRKILQNFESIVVAGLPKEKLRQSFQDQEVAKDTILDSITFFQKRLAYMQGLKTKGIFVRDYGTHEEEITIEGSAVGKRIDELIEYYDDKKADIEERFIQIHDSHKNKKNKRTELEASYCYELSSFAAEIQLYLYTKVANSFKEIALTMRSKSFDSNEEHLIDIFDLQCKEWGFLLHFLFNSGLGCGDYGHIVIEHAPMLLRVFRSLKNYSNQGLEAAHLLEKVIYSKATSHDGPGYATSIFQVLVHTYAAKLLFIRLCFRQAKLSIEKGKPFHFRGCGWQVPKQDFWDVDDKKIIFAIDMLLNDILGEDYTNYIYENKCCKVDEPNGNYNHQAWEKNLPHVISQLPNSFAFSGDSECSDSMDQQDGPCTPESMSFTGDTSTPTDINSSCFPDLEQLWTQNNMTRVELATLTLPPIKAIDLNSVTEVVDPQNLTCPWDLDFRPPKTVVTALTHMISDLESVIDDDSCVCAVNLGSHGSFARASIDLWDKTFKVDEISREVNYEHQWLSASTHKTLAIKNVLGNLRPEQTVLKHDHLNLDATDVSSLVGERYVSGFCLSVVCLKFLEEVKLHGNTGVVFLPTLTQMWILSLATSKELREKLINYIAIEDLRNLSLVLLPLHVKQCHWGLLCLDVGSKKLFYDDGLHWAPPNQAVELTKKLLDALKEMSLEFQTGFTQDFEKDKWDLSFTRFAMPDQPKTGVGSGSCGVGVILAAKDMFIQRTSLPTFFWTFDEMEKHRKEILFKIIQWMK